MIEQSAPRSTCGSSESSSFLWKSAFNVRRLDTLVPADAAEYPSVVIPIMTQQYMMRPRRLGIIF